MDVHCVYHAPIQRGDDQGYFLDLRMFIIQGMLINLGCQHF